MSETKPEGKDILQDPTAESADPELPAFLARPHGAPVYHGFPLIPETLTDGWLLGAITAFEDPNGCEYGDAFVQAPDGSRAGLVWEVGSGKLEQILPPDSTRWGVWAVWFRKPVHSVNDIIANFRDVLPELKKKHAEVSGGA
jgi:hypothetical protein